MKTFLAALLLTVATTASAQSADPAAPAPAPAAASPCCANGPDAQPTPTVTASQAPTPADPDQEDDGGWKRPVGRRFLHGFRLGWTYVFNMEKPTRENGMSLASEYKLKSPNMMLIGYEGFYRIIGHSWLNVLMVGNVTVAGLEQSKFIPAASGLLGFEMNQSFQLGVGVNVTPDKEAPTHMIVAAGWTPKVGSIMTPVHFFFVPDTERNHRMGATIGMTW